jgi:hypothetical protein
MIYPLSQAWFDEKTRTDTPAGLIEELIGVPGGGQERMIARQVLRLTR